MEYNAEEAKQTNIIGTKNILKASIKNRVSKFLHISTDKLFYPKSVMGQTKQLAERYIQSINKKRDTNQNFNNKIWKCIGLKGSVILILFFY